MDTIATPTLWAATIGVVLLLVTVDFLLTRKPHEVGLREAGLWSAFYLAAPVAFGGLLIWRYGSDIATEYYAGYLVEKSLSVDNLFVFMLLLSAFAVPRVLQQRVLLFGIAGALVLRGVFIALGAAALQAFDITFLLFGLVLLATGLKVFKDARSGHSYDLDVNSVGAVRVVRRFFPVAQAYEGSKLVTRVEGKRALTPLALVATAVLATDMVFAVDSVPAVYGITGDPYLVFATNAFALLGLRALYFLLAGALTRLVHLGVGLAAILGFIGAKLVLHWAHGVWPAVPQLPTAASLIAVLGILLTVTVTSLVATRPRSTAVTRA